MANNNDVLDYAGLVQLKTETDKRYLRKLTYEYNKEISFGSSGYLKIGSFPMYDTNITIDIDSTTSTTYHATIVIATQNVSTSSIGSAHQVNVYGDASDTITSAIRVVWTSGSRNYNVYFVPPAWSKNLVHIRAVALSSEPSDICIAQEGTAPSSTSGLEATNLLKSNFVPTSRTINSKALSSNITLSASDVSAVPTTRKVNNKALSSDITLSASDVSALPSNTSYVSSVNGDSGAITNVAKTDTTNAFTGYLNSFTKIMPYEIGDADVSGTIYNWLYNVYKTKKNGSGETTITASYGVAFPDTTGYSANKTLATTDDVATKQNTLTTSSVNDGTLNKAIGFDANGNLVKGTAGGSGKGFDNYSGGTLGQCWTIADPTADDVNGFSMQIGESGFTIDTGDITNNEWGGNNVLWVQNGSIGSAYNGQYYFNADKYGSLTITDANSSGNTMFYAGNGLLYMYDDNVNVRGLNVSSNTFQYYGNNIALEKNTAKLYSIASTSTPIYVNGSKTILLVPNALTGTIGGTTTGIITFYGVAILITPFAPSSTQNLNYTLIYRSSATAGLTTKVDLSGRHVSGSGMRIYGNCKLLEM